MIKIILVEDHHIVREGIRALLDNERDFEVVFEAGNGQDVLDYLESGRQPDLIMTDMNMPGLDGYGILKALQSKYQVLVLSMLDHEKYVIQAIQAGAKGYLLKNAGKKEMLFAIRHIADGGRYISPEISLKLLSRFAELERLQPTVIELGFDLTERETEVLNLIARGLTNREMAAKLFSSRRTIEGHRQVLLEKTGSGNTATLIKFAVQNGLVK